MKSTTLPLVLFFLILFSFKADSKHIVSGSIGYECLGNNDYEITMILFRDCDGGGPEYDSPAYFGIYKNDGTLFEQMSAFPQGIVNTPLESSENCLIDPPPCIEKATYQFTINLPYEVTGYTIAYQRCCWSVSILNIDNPGEHGITVKTEITDLAQTECNTQELLDIPMAFSSCPGVDVSIPFPLYDSEGDSLVFEVCFPLDGAGSFGTPQSPGNPENCDGVQPVPACPPPYNPLPYAAGFSEQNPFPTMDGISFNSGTNAIEFTPSTLGLYIYAFCVTEFRNGEIMSQYRYNIFANRQFDVSSEELQEEMNVHEAWYSDDKEAIVITSENSIEKVNISVYSVDGKVMDQRVIQNQTQSLISSEGWPLGIYFISIGNNEFNEVYKIYVK